MHYTILLFSPTGGTAKVVAALTAPWGEAAHTVDLTNAEANFSAVSLRPEDVAVIAVPSYGGRDRSNAGKGLLRSLRM